MRKIPYRRPKMRPETWGMVRLGCVCVGLIMMGCLSANGETLSAKSVLPGCQDYLDREATVSGGRCMGLVEGLLMLGYTQMFCAPKFSSPDQFIRLIVLYIEDRPEREQEDFRVLALEALARTFPCKDAPNRREP
jgi:Rap1a immunity proteins